MADFTLHPGRRTLHGQFSRDLEPALVIHSGDRVSYRTLDVSWGLEPPLNETTARQKFEPRQLPQDDGPCLIGPTAIAEALPGSVLEIHLERLVPGSWGWTWAGEIGFFNSDLNRALGVAEGHPRLLRWDLDREKQAGINQYGHIVALHPFLGTIGLCPDREGWQSAWVPRRTGGNMDCKELTAGSVLFLPIEVPGGLVSLGDGHAAQGDGEVGGTALECPFDQVVLRYVVRDDLELQFPRAKTPRGWVTFGFAGSLDEAAVQALTGMLIWMETEFGLSRKEALALASVVVDLHVTQMVNGVRGTHAILPNEALPAAIDNTK